VRVTVHHPEDLETALLGVALGEQMVLRIDGVDPGRLGDVPTWIEHDDVTARRGLPGEQPACLVGQTVVRVPHHLEVGATGEAEHDAESTLDPPWLRRA
jgi:hypothetical protein